MSHSCASSPPTQLCHTLHDPRAWQKAVSDVFFALDIHHAPAAGFRGSLCSTRAGRLSISHLRADPACYHRTAAHLRHCTQEAFLITLPLSHAVTFRQLQRRSTCQRGHFLLEMSHEPYDFSATHTSELMVLKVPQEALRPHLRHPERYCAVDFDGRTGIGRLFRQHVLNTARLLHQLDHHDAAFLEKQLLELFARAVERDDRILTANDSTVRAAHLLRIERYAHTHLDRHDLCPEQVAGACGISVRYLHHIFRDTGTSFSCWLQTRRLLAAHQQLTQQRFVGTLTQLAYSLGFTDPSHFSRAYRRHYGESPRDTLRKHAQATAF